MTNDQLKQRAISETVEVLKQNQNQTLNHFYEAEVNVFKEFHSFLIFILLHCNQFKRENIE
jgi:hypothetical protein